MLNMLIVYRCRVRRAFREALRTMYFELFGLIQGYNQFIGCYKRKGISLRLILQLLGLPQLHIDDKLVATDRRKAIALLAYLAVNDIGHARQRYSRESLSALLWPDYEQAKAFSNLRRTIWEVHQAIGENWLIADRESLRLNADAEIDLDVARFQDLLSQSRKQSDPILRIPLLVESTKLCRNHFLNGFSLKDAYPFNEWAFAESEDLRSQLMDALTSLSEDHCMLGQADKAIPYARRLISLDPLNESAHRHLMEVYIQAGQHSVALKQYRTCEQILRKELNLDPQPETRALYKKILKGEIKLVHVERQTETVTPKHNLLMQLTTFIGRKKEQDEITYLITNNRLVTLTGMGGMGKTRLALEVGEQSLDDYANGVWQVELVSLNDPMLVPQTVAMVLGITQQPNRDLTATLIEALCARTLLLIFDNCEHLLDASAELVNALLKNCPNLKVLATSREALGIAGEALYQVPPLMLPDIQPIEPLEKLTQYESIRLFNERARLSMMSFLMTMENAYSIAQICRHLDGIPLAIELAAARVKVMSVQQIAVRLDDRFNLLKAGSRTVIQRHQTLRATIDWSYELLTDQERVLLQRLAIFSGSWSLEAAEAVGMGGNVDESNLLDLLTNLVEKSLVIVKADRQRYGMLETVRQYAKEKLMASGEAETYYQAHLEYFLKLAEDAEPHLKGAGQVQWINRLDDELDNLRMALDWSISSSTNREAGLKLSGALWRFWQRSMRAGEGRIYLARLLDQVSMGPTREVLAYAKALTAAGALAYFQSDYISAEVFRQEALNIFRKLSDANGIADSQHGLGNIALSQGNYETARSMYEESLKIRQKLGQREPLAGTLSNLGLIAYNEGDYMTARSLEMESRIIFQEFGNKAGIAFTLNVLGNIARHQGDLQAARKYHEESITLCDEAADQWGLANALNGLADVALVEGDLYTAYSLCRDSLNLLREGGAKEGIAYCLESIAAISVARGQSSRSARLLGAAAALRTIINLPLTPTDLINYEHNMAALHSQLDDIAFNVAWEEGQVMPLDQVIECALSESLSATKSDTI